MFNIFFANDWIRTTDFWSQKRPLYQLNHNHCPSKYIVGSKKILYHGTENTQNLFKEKYCCITLSLTCLPGCFAYIKIQTD